MEKDEKGKDTTPDLASKILSDKGRAAQIRLPYEPMWDSIIDFVLHYRRTIGGAESKGLKTGEKVYDTTPLQALNMLADGLHGYLVSPSIRWFSLRLPNILEFPITNFGNMRKWNGKRADSMPEIRTWLGSTEDVLYSAFLRSNFYEATPEYFRDGGSIGTANIYVQDNIRSGRTIYNVTHPRECYLVEDKSGKVSAIYREFDYTLDQCVEEFGLDAMVKADPTFKIQYDKDRFALLRITHAIYPRNVYDPQKADVLNMPWASVWVLDKNKKVLRNSGKTFFPHLTWRWRKNGDEWYGRSPAWDAYVQIVKSNQTEKTLIEVQEMMAKPPYYMTEDLRGKVRLRPNGRTYLSQSQYDRPPAPLNLNLSGFPITIERQEMSQKIINDFFHTDLFFLLSDAARNKVPLTATQVIEISGEKAAILGTRIGRLNQEFLNPTLDIQFSIENEAGRIPQPPDALASLSNTAVEIEYMGPLGQAQKRLFRTQGIFAGLEAGAKIGEVFPDALDRIDPDDVMVDVLEALGFPQKDMRTDDEVEKIRNARNAQAQQEREMSIAATMAEKVPKISRAVEKGSVMDAITRGRLTRGNA